MKEGSIRASKAEGRKTAVCIAQADEINGTLGLWIRIIFARIPAFTRKRRFRVRVDVDVELGWDDWSLERVLVLPSLSGDLGQGSRYTDFNEIRVKGRK